MGSPTTRCSGTTASRARSRAESWAGREDAGEPVAARAAPVVPPEAVAAPEPAARPDLRAEAGRAARQADRAQRAPRGLRGQREPEVAEARPAPPGQRARLARSEPEVGVARRARPVRPGPRGQRGKEAAPAAALQDLVLAEAGAAWFRRPAERAA